MAKSARSSAVKTNNQRLKKNVFGPVEAERAARLSAKLLEIAAQPKPLRDVEMNEEPVAEAKEGASAEKTEVMDVDAGAKPASSGRVEKKFQKRRGKKSSIVFPKYGERKSIRKKK